MPRFVAICAALLALTIASSAWAGFVNRSSHIVAVAIGKSRPKLPYKSRLVWAKLLIKTAKKHDFDPFTGVAIVHNESRWHPGAVSANGEDFGLGQIRARFIKGCRRDIPAAKDTSKSCTAVKARLLSLDHGIRNLGRAITQWRKTCRKVTGKAALLRRWLHGYGGMGKTARNGRPFVLCGMKKVGKKWRDLPLRKEVRRIINYRKKLIRQSRQWRKRRKRQRRA
jgi:hypothetical protein